MSKWIKKGDKVVVTKGNDLGRTGTVKAKVGDRLIVEGICMHKRHMKRRSEETRSEIVSIEGSIHMSNVAICNDAGKKLKLKVTYDQNGHKKLVYVEEGKELLYRDVVKAGK